MSIANKRFGRLVTVDTFIENGRRYWNCVCDCGTKRAIYHYALTGGHSQSCGCARKERATDMCRKRALPNNESASNDLIYKYKLRAKKENIEWLLTKEQCIHLFKQNCQYCGTEPRRVKRTNSSNYVYNGIDRVDNAKGYTIENSVSCCMRCNYMKSDLNVEEFYDHIKKIYERIK